MVELVSNMNVTEQTNKNGSVILSLILQKLARRYSIPFKYGGKISRSQFNQALSQIRFNRDELKDILIELSNRYPNLQRYKRGIKINPNGDVK